MGIRRNGLGCSAHPRANSCRMGFSRMMLVIGGMGDTLNMKGSHDQEEHQGKPKCYHMSELCHQRQYS